MSERAHAYYDARAAQLSRPLPTILDGVPEQIIHARAEPTIERLALHFAAYAEEVEPFVLQGVRYVGDRDRPSGYSDEEWEDIFELPRYGNAYTATQYASKRMAQHLLTKTTPGNIVYLEALADGEAPRLTMNKATGNKPLARAPSQEMACVVLLARTITPERDVAATYLTVLWAQLIESSLGKKQQKSTFLTPHYLGMPVDDREIDNLPPLP